MNESNAKFYYGESGPVFILKITGTLRFNQCSALEFFLKERLQKNLPNTLLIDLSQTESLDSTALGLLAQIALQFEKLKHKKADLYCPENDLKKVLLSMSLEQLFHFTQQPPVISTILPEFSTQPGAEETQTERVLAAHEALMSISEKNKKEFKSVVEMLQESLGKSSKK
jgi:anti-anti-sigma factor